MDHQLLGRRIGAHLIVREIARRGVAVLCESVHVGIGHMAMAKVLGRVAPSDTNYQRYQDRLFHEARALSQVSHPSLPKIFDFGVLDDGTAYLLTEHRRGEWLSERLARGDEPPPLWVVVAMLCQLAEALAMLPEHFDLNPEDLLLCEDEAAPGGWRVWLADLGSVPLLSGSRLPVPPTGSLLPGESTYLAPELCRGGHPDAKTTVYALAVLAYHLLTGAPPFSGSAFDIRGQHLHAPPAPLRSLVPALPDELSALVHGMLAKDPAERPTLPEVAAALAAMPRPAARSARGEIGYDTTAPSASAPPPRKEAPPPLTTPRPIFLPPAGLPALELPQAYERLRRAMQLLRQILDEATEELRLRQLLVGAGALVPADRGAILRLEGGQASLACARRFGAIAVENELARAPASVLAALQGSGAQKGGGAVLSADATLDDRFLGDHEIIMEGIRSVLALPLRRGGELAGVLYLDSQEAAGRFSALDRELLTLLADVAMRV